jgi:signal transduction histidine kinase
MMPFLVILALAILNLSVSVSAMQPALATHRNFHAREMAQAARLEVRLARTIVAVSPTREALREGIDDALGLSGDPDACLAVITKAGVLVAGSSLCKDFRGVRDDIWQAVSPESAKRTWFVATQEGPYRIISSRDLNDRDTDTSMIYLMTIVGIVVATAGQFLLWYALNRIHLSRVADIAGSARRMSGGDLAERVRVTGRHDSYLVLAIALNDIAQRFQTQAEAMRIANNAAAHDLRMPLTRVLNSLQRILDHRDMKPRLATMVERSQEEVERAISQFSALNTLARLETGISLDTMEMTDLAQVVITACELFDPVLEDAGILLEVNITNIQARVQVQLLTQAIANLLQNSSKYAGAGALVTVTCSRRGDTAEIIVADNGPGVPPEDLQRVMERYVRLDVSRSTDGFCLGLSMVEAVAKLHGGAFELKNANGLMCTLTMPINV